MRTRRRAENGDGRRRGGAWARAAAGAALVAALLAAAPATAQVPGVAGRPITKIEFQGLKLLSEETVLFYLGLAPGQTLDLAELDRKIKELWSRRLVDDVAVDAVPEGEGVRLVIRVKERPVLLSVEYQGLKRLAKTDIEDRKGREHIDLGEGSPIRRGELQRLTAVIEDMYREKGYRFAQVITTSEEPEPGQVRVTLTVDEGDRVRIGDIDFEGNEVFGDLRLRWVMKNTKESGIVTRMLKKDIYNTAKLDEDLTRVRDLYRSAGYKNVLVGEPRIDVTTKGDKRRLVLTVPIDEGERWRFGKVTVEGNKRFTEKAVLRLFTLKPGGWLRTDVIDDAVEKVKQSYDNSGYIFSRVETELVEQPDYVADLVVKISENDQFKIGRIEFEGNTTTRDKVLRRELRVQEGYVVNLGGVKSSVYKVNQLGYFKLDEGEPVKFDANSDKRTVDLVFAGKEDNRTELQFGAGYSDFQGFFGQLAFRTHNFLGRGETVGFSIESGTQRDLFDVSYLVPWFLDRPQSLGAQAFRSELQYTLQNDTYNRKSQGGVLTYGRSFGLFQSASISYNRSNYQDRISGFDADGNPVSLYNLKINNSSVRPGWVYDSIDNRFEPTRGQRIRASVEVAGGPLGGDNYFVRPEVNYTLFRPLTNYPVRSVWGINVEAGRIQPFGSYRNATTGDQVSRVLSPLERYFLGGENSVRGHRYRSIFVRDENGLPVVDPTIGTIGLGGDEFFQVNVEYHLLLGGPFRLIFFVDGGNVFGDFERTITGPDGEQTTELVRQSIDVTNLRWTAGAELRLLVPVFGAPLRFIYAKNLDPLIGDEFDSFRFSIGSAF
jgi:outer membrane protein insertion porin family